MKHIVLLLILFFVACNTTYKTTNYSVNKCFSNKELKKIKFNNPNSAFKTINIVPIVTNKNNCIGLYSNIVNSIKSISLNKKILKFEKSIYIYNEKDTINNNKMLKLFVSVNKKYFSEAQLDSIIKIFKKGNELKGSIL